MKLINKRRRKKKNKKTRGQELTGTITQLRGWLEVNSKMGRVIFQEEQIRRPMRKKPTLTMTNFIQNWLLEHSSDRKLSS